VATETLESELLAVPGVASAEVDVGNGATPEGVKVSLTPDADARRVSVEVQRVLAAHGVRSRISSGDDGLSVVSSPEPVVDDETSRGPGSLITARVLAAAIEREGVDQVLPTSEEPSIGTSPPPDPFAAPPIAAVPMPSASDPPARISVPDVTSVSLEERRDGLTASVVLADGRRASRAVGSGADELDTAVIAAVAEAVGESVAKVAVDWLKVDDGTVVTVVIKRSDGSLAAGAGVMRVGPAFAVGIATRAALEG